VYSYPDRVVGLRLISELSHTSAQSFTRMRASVVVMNSPFDFALSTDVRKSSASRFVRKPRLSVCRWFGVR
jgi:hypothetical protein